MKTKIIQLVIVLSLIFTTKAFANQEYSGTVEGTGEYCSLWLHSEGGQVSIHSNGYAEYAPFSLKNESVGITSCKTGLLSTSKERTVYRDLISSLMNANCFGLCWVNPKYKGITVSIEYNQTGIPNSVSYSRTEFFETKGKACRTIKKNKKVKNLKCLLK